MSSNLLYAIATAGTAAEGGARATTPAPAADCREWENGQKLVHSASRRAVIGNKKITSWGMHLFLVIQAVL